MTQRDPDGEQQRPNCLRLVPLDEVAPESSLSMMLAAGRSAVLVVAVTAVWILFFDPVFLHDMLSLRWQAVDHQRHIGALPIHHTHRNEGL